MKLSTFSRSFTYKLTWKRSYDKREGTYVSCLKSVGFVFFYFKKYPKFVSFWCFVLKRFFFSGKTASVAESVRITGLSHTNYVHISCLTLDKFDTFITVTIILLCEWRKNIIFSWHNKSNFTQLFFSIRFYSRTLNFDVASLVSLLLPSFANLFLLSTCCCCCICRQQPIFLIFFITILQE